MSGARIKCFQSENKKETWSIKGFFYRQTPYNIGMKFTSDQRHILNHWITMIICWGLIIFSVPALFFGVIWLAQYVIAEITSTSAIPFQMIAEWKVWLSIPFVIMGGIGWLAYKYQKRQAVYWNKYKNGFHW